MASCNGAATQYVANQTCNTEPLSFTISGLGSFMCIAQYTQDLRLYVPLEGRSNKWLIGLLWTQVSQLGLEPTLC